MDGTASAVQTASQLQPMDLKCDKCGKISKSKAGLTIHQKVQHATTNPGYPYQQHSVSLTSLLFLGRLLMYVTSLCVTAVLSNNPTRTKSPNSPHPLCLKRSGTSCKPTVTVLHAPLTGLLLSHNGLILSTSLGPTYVHLDILEATSIVMKGPTKMYLVVMRCTS